MAVNAINVTEFKTACQTIVNNRQEKSLNYCAAYAEAGLEMNSFTYMSHQVPYLLSNMTHWRGPLAKETRTLLKGLL